MSTPSIVSRANYNDVTYYDCTGKPNGNYLHPSDCTRYITCHNGRAADMACPDCGLANNPYQCAGSEFLFYKAATDRCDWPRDTECQTDPESLVKR